MLGMPPEQREKLRRGGFKGIWAVLRKEGQEIEQVRPELPEVFAEFPGVPADVLPDHALTKLMALARVPADSASQRWPLISGAESLRQGVCYELNCQWLLHRRASAIKPQRGQFEDKLLAALRQSLKQLRHVKRLSSGLRETLQNLDPYLRIQLAAPLQSGSYVDEIKNPIGTLADCSAKAVERVKVIERARRKGARRPAGRPSSDGLGFAVSNRLLRFTLHLLWDVRAAGGRLTLDKNMRKGTLPEALKLLSPCLPPGFVPDELPLSTLQRVKALDQKTREFGSPSR
jgi:hypothetical protein